MDLSTLQSMEATAKELQAAKKKEAREAEEVAKRAEALGMALARLRTSWKAEDHGKYGDAWYFLAALEMESPESFGCQPAWIPELTDDPAVVGLPREKKTWFRPEIIPAVRIVTLDAAVRRPCPTCGKNVLVVGCYEQEDDSPEGDWWAETLYVLCESCQALTQFAKRGKAWRFQSFTVR